MTFWNSTEIEPKRDFRWIGYIALYAPSAGLGDTKVTEKDYIHETSIVPFSITSWSAPSLNMDIETIINPTSGERHHLPKTLEWEDLDITMIDMEDIVYPIVTKISSNNTMKLYEWLGFNGYDARDPNLSQMLTSLQKPWLARLTVHRIDSGGEVYEKWVYRDPILTNIKFGNDFDYNSDQISTVKMSFKVKTVEYINDARARSPRTEKERTARGITATWVADKEQNRRIQKKKGS